MSEVAGLVVVTLYTIKLLTDPAEAAFACKHPFSHTQRWIMPNVLIVTAGEFGHPMAFVVQFKIVNLLFHLCFAW